MKKLFLAIAAATALGFGACSDFEKSDNGSLDGYWQLTNIDTLATGRSGDVRERMIFWSVQAGLIELNDRNTEGLERYPSILFRFERSGDSLKLLGNPKPRLTNRVKGDRDIASRMQCGFYGLSDEGDTLRILRLEEKRMTLQSDDFRMHFRKY